MLTYIFSKQALNQLMLLKTVFVIKMETNREGMAPDTRWPFDSNSIKFTLSYMHSRHDERSHASLKNHRSG